MLALTKVHPSPAPDSSDKLNMMLRECVCLNLRKAAVPLWERTQVRASEVLDVERLEKLLADLQSALRLAQGSIALRVGGE